MPKDGLSNPELVLLLALAERADANGEAWPSHEHLEAMTGIRIRQQQRHLSALDKRGVIRIIPGGGRHKSNTYVLRRAEKFCGGCGARLPTGASATGAPPPRPAWILDSSLAAVVRGPLS
jgi:hypothetical protein